ncbi:hypothetical protein OIU76_020057 [Salix suchowensis]|nr:hypothetical protein OIU76_020057 [Salix suchowensis]
MDYIIDTVSAVHALAPYLSLLKTNGKLVTLGLPEKPLELPIFPLVLGHNLSYEALDSDKTSHDMLSPISVPMRIVE